MARGKFTSTANYLRSGTSDGALITAYPFTVSLCYYSTSTATQIFFSWCDSSSSVGRSCLYGSSSGYHYLYVNNDIANSHTADIRTNQWTNFTAKRTGTGMSDGDIFITGFSSQSTGSALSVNGSADRVGIGCLCDYDASLPAVDSYLAEVGVWDRALSDAECDALNDFVSPLCFPEGLIWYNPLSWGAGDVKNWMSAKWHLTELGTVGTYNHPGGIVYPSSFGRVIHAAAAGGTDYSLTADSGSVAVTGAAATLDSSLAVAVGTSTITGADATIDLSLWSYYGDVVSALSTVTFSASLNVAAGAVAATGAAATADIAVAVAAGSVAVAGATASLEEGEGVDAEAGTVAIAGVAATADVSLSVAAGSVAATGVAATLEESGATHETLSCEAGSFTIVGTVWDEYFEPIFDGQVTFDLTTAIAAGTVAIDGAATVGGSSLSVAAGSVEIATYDVPSQHGLAAWAGSVDITGLAVTVDGSLSVAAGSVAAAGAAATCDVALAVVAGTVDIVGAEVTLEESGATHEAIIAAAGSVAVDGTTAADSVSVAVAAGSVAIAGAAVGETVGATAGAISVAGVDATFDFVLSGDPNLPVEPGAIAIEGAAASLEDSEGALCHSISSVLDQWSITPSILDQWSITPSVLDQWTITPTVTRCGVDMANQQYETLRLRGSYYNADDELADPATSVSCVVVDPSGTSTTYDYPADISKDSTGVYDLEIVPDTAGIWQIYWKGVGTYTTVSDSNVSEVLVETSPVAIGV